MILLLALLVACGDGSGDDDNNDGGNADANAPRPTQMAATSQLRVTVGRATAFNIPDRNGAEVFTLVEGDTVEAAGRSEPDALGTVFYVVEFGDLSGWLAETQVEVVRGNPDSLLLVPDDAFALNVIEETEQARIRSGESNENLGFQVFARALEDNAIVYDEPDLEAEIIQTVESGTQLEIVASTIPTADELVFYSVRLPGQGLGFVTNRMFEHVGDLSLRQQIMLEDSVLTATPTRDPDEATALALAPTLTPFPPSATPAGETTLPPESANIASPTLTLTPFGTNPESAGDTAATPAISPTITPTSTPASSPTPFPTATPRSLRPAEPPLLELGLPPEWDQAHALVPLESSIFQDTDIVLSVYEGPVGGDATGRITVLWRFPEIFPTNSEEVTLWPNAVLYLRSLLFSNCTVGIYTDQREFYSIGGRQAEGTTFSAIDCLDGSPDVAGWFGALQVDGENYVFYMTVEPAGEINRTRGFLQSLVRNASFVLPGT